MTYSQGDILLVPVPFSDLSTNKKRPVIVLTKKEYNSTSEDIVVVAMTSNPQAKNFSIIISSDDVSEGVLKVTSFVRTDKIYVLSKQIVISRFGRVNNDLLSRITDSIIDIISYNHSEFG